MAQRRAGRGLEPAGRSLEPAGRALEPAERASEQAGRVRKKKRERKNRAFLVCSGTIGHCPL